jgi:cAMP phosphodiesterase
MAEITIVGAFGTKGENSETTCIVLNDKNIMDAGNLIKGLKDQCAEIDTIWLTHSHLDHIVDIAFLLDCYFEERKKPLAIAALPETIKVLQKHIFNELVWPDFSVINLINSQEKAMVYRPITIGERYHIGGDDYLEPFKTNHTVPSCGYILSKGTQSIAITADTYKSDTIWEMLNQRTEIGSLLIECSFPSAMSQLAHDSKHLTPLILSEELEKLNRDIDIYINHLKESGEAIIKKELSEIPSLANATIVHDYQTISF